MLTPPQSALLRETLAAAQNPLFFLDDDADGLASFLLLYRMHRRGRYMLLKTSPKLDAPFARKVEEWNPDTILVLDVPIVEQEFIDLAKRPIFWIDHHQPLDLQNIHYFNPRLKDPEAYVPTTYMAWQVSQNPADLWIAVTGCLADYYMPDCIDQFIERYPDLLSKKTDLPTALFHEPVGQLVKLFFFLLKGPTAEVRKSIQVLMKIQSPDEIMKQQTPAGKFLYRRFEMINKRYEVLLEKATTAVTEGKILLFHYTEEHWSFTANLANELVALYPEKVIIICREKSGEMKCSLRARFPILPALQKALVGLKGYGGGHANACGAVIKKEEWELFLERFEEAI